MPMWGRVMTWMTTYRFKNHMSGEDVVARAVIEREKTGKCVVCSINLYSRPRYSRGKFVADTAPRSKYLPCGIEGCPYE